MRVIGLMSGTSADGLDIALCDITGAPPKLKVSLMAGTTVPYPANLRAAILGACDRERSRVHLISELNFILAQFTWSAILRFMGENDIFEDMDLIGSHGQTVWHNVNADGQVTSTLQIGSPAVIAEATGITTISDFRARDVAAGGQGAPLTAYVDWLLLRHQTQWRAVQNIGGMGNVTILPPLNDDTNDMLAFDTGPGNVLIDAAVSILTDGELTYDHDGAMAQAGTVNGQLLEAWLDHPYYKRQPPKTTGRELYTFEMARDYIAQAVDLSPNDIVATLTALTAYSIADAYQNFVPQAIGQVIIGGGGGRNPVLMQHLRDLLAVPVFLHDDIGIDSDFKEAMVFAVLAYETWHNRTGTLPSQTGANHATVLGSITPGDNYQRLLYDTWVRPNLDE